MKKRIKNKILQSALNLSETKRLSNSKKFNVLVFLKQINFIIFIIFYQGKKLRESNAKERKKEAKSKEFF